MENVAQVLGPKPAIMGCIRCPAPRTKIRSQKLPLCCSCAVYFYKKNADRQKEGLSKLSVEEFIAACPSKGLAIPKPIPAPKSQRPAPLAPKVPDTPVRVAKAREGESQEFLPGFLICGEKMKELSELILKVAATESTVLITGETGTGKEHVAKAIHEKSPRSDKPFVVIDCTGLKEDLVESELFGHEQGSFTGAIKAKKGLFEVASEGTVFLDEISELPLPLQAKLLRILEYGEFRRIGGVRYTPVNVRVVAATNKDIKALVAAGKFREDLMYRLDVVRLDIPPLRERREEVAILADYFLKQKRNGRDLRLSLEAREVLCGYRWSGNVRELKNLMDRLCIFASRDPIPLEDLPPHIWERSTAEMRAASPPNGDLSLDAAVGRHIQFVFERSGRNVAKTAKALQVCQKTVYSKLKKQGLF